jgi:hypothetical protein
MTAAFLHMVASAVVVFNSARLVRFGEDIAPHAPAVPSRPRADHPPAMAAAAPMPA